MPGAREHVDLTTPPHIGEAGVLEHKLPLCFQQSTGNSTGPKVDVVLRVLWHFFVDDDIGDLKAPARL